MPVSIVVGLPSGGLLTSACGAQVWCGDGVPCCDCGYLVWRVREGVVVPSSMGDVHPSMAHQSLAMLLAVTWASSMWASTLPIWLRIWARLHVWLTSPPEGFFLGGMPGVCFAPTGVCRARVLACAVLAAGVYSAPSGSLSHACALPSSSVAPPALSGSSAKASEVHRPGARQGEEVPGCTILPD